MNLFYQMHFFDMLKRMQRPKVSILMAAWNRARFLGRSVQSIQLQTFRDWELIITDDGSTDETPQVVRRLVEGDKRIIYVRLDHLGRIAKVSNAGVRRACGEYVAILDDDDWWVVDDKLEKQVKFLDTHPEYVGCGGGLILVDEAGRETGRVLKPEHDEDIRKYALIANPMANATALFRRADAEKIGWYDETMLQFADWDFWLKMGHEGKLYNFPEYFMCYRMWGGGMSFARQKETAASARRIVFRHRKSYPNFSLAFLYVAAYSIYAYFPELIRRTMNPWFSRLKKIIFANRKH